MTEHPLGRFVRIYGGELTITPSCSALEMPFGCTLSWKHPNGGVINISSPNIDRCLAHLDNLARMTK